PLADVYALGAILYHTLTGQPPFRGETSLGILHKVLNEEPQLPSTLRKRIPADLETICLKCLQKEPAKRYASAHELASDLRRFLNHEPIVARASSPWEKAAKWAKRRPAAAALIGVTALALVSPISGGVWYNAQLNASLRVSRANEEAAKQSAVAEAKARKDAEDALEARRRADEALARERRTPEEKEKDARDAERIKAQQRFQKALAAGKALELDLGSGVKLEMLLIPAGKFMMGSPETEKDHQGDETQHEVTITKPFYMGMYQVTQEQYQQVMGNNPSDFKGAQNPVEQVSWNDAQEFCRKATVRTAGVPPAVTVAGETPAVRVWTVRLPTEAEWEYACRAGTTTRFYTGDGDDDLCRAGWVSGNSWAKAHAVGGKEANGWGLYDMHGNVFQWCADWYKEYEVGPATDPTGPAAGAVRVLRGGSWFYFPLGCRAASRFRCHPDGRNVSFAFRVVVAAASRTP
ncbi:MAG: SUMF1/EgtB/PvdO family nonheme iron enzyme, partial [Planctomycetota bacterium]